MSDFTNLSNFISQATGGGSGSPEYRSLFKSGTIAGAAAAAFIAGRLESLFTMDGNPAGGAAPGGTWANPDNTTNGGLKQTDPGGSREKWLTYAGGGANVQGGVILYDRLGHIGARSGTTTTAQTFTGTPTRNTGGVGNHIWIEINTIIGTTATTFTCTYTNQAGTGSRVSVAAAIGGTGDREVNRIIEAPLASGDYGVQAIADFDLLASTGTVGDICVVLARPLLFIPFSFIGAGGDVAALSKGLPPIKIDTDACLCLAWVANTTAVPVISDMNFFFCEV